MSGNRGAPCKWPKGKEGYEVAVSWTEEAWLRIQGYLVLVN